MDAAAGALATLSLDDDPSSRCWSCAELLSAIACQVVRRAAPPGRECGCDWGNLFPATASSLRVYRPCVRPERQHGAPQVQQLRRLRLVCRTWRDGITYSCITSLALQGGDRGVVLRSRGSPVDRGGCGGSLAVRELGSQAAKLDRMERFTSLRCLNLHDLGLKDVPPQLRDLAQLEHLYLQENYLRSLPVVGADGRDYRRLTVLDVSSQRSDALAELMDTACTHLTLPLAAALSLPRSIKALCLAGLGLRHLPAIISRLHELEVLDLGNNHCLDLSTSEWLADFKQLRCLSIAYTRSALPNVPAYIGRMELTELDLSTNGSVSTPLATALFESPQLSDRLRSLDLSGCVAETELPIEIRGLHRIEELNLSGWCALARLPEWIGRMEHLAVLSLFLCIELVALPLSLERRSSLRSLDLRECLTLHGMSRDEESHTVLGGLSGVEFALGSLSRAQPQLRMRVGARTVWSEAAGFTQIDSKDSDQWVDTFGFGAGGE